MWRMGVEVRRTETARERLPIPRSRARPRSNVVKSSSPPLATMDLHWDSYSTDESGNASDESDISGDQARTLVCDADGKALCTCGRRSRSTIYRHLGNVHLR